MFRNQNQLESGGFKTVCKLFSRIGQFISGLANQVCRKYNNSLGELCFGSCSQLVVGTGGSLSWIAVREFGYSGADVARYYVCGKNFCATLFVASRIKPDIDDLIKML